MKLMTLFILLFFMSPFVSNAKVEIDNKSLTYFENPFLIGDWYFLNQIMSIMIMMFFI